MFDTMKSSFASGAVVVCAALSTPAFSQDMMNLTVTPAGTNSTPVEFTLADLDAMDQIAFTTSTIWTDEDTTFSGVSLKALLSGLGIEDGTLELVALNDYAVSMPIEELEDSAPIVASRRNGDTMSVRDKGPFWVVYPYDSDPKYRTETHFSRSVWQLNRLKVVD